MTAYSSTPEIKVELPKIRHVEDKLLLSTQYWDELVNLQQFYHLQLKYVTSFQGFNFGVRVGYDTNIYRWIPETLIIF